MEAVGAASEAFGVSVKEFGTAKNVMTNIRETRLVQSGHDMAQAIAEQIVENVKRNYDVKNLKLTMRELAISENAEIRQLVKEYVEALLQKERISGLSVVIYDHTSPLEMKGKSIDDFVREEADIVIGSMSLGGRGVDYKHDINMHLDVSGTTSNKMIRFEDLRQALGRVDRFEGQRFSRSLYAVEKVLSDATTSVVQAKNQFLAAGSARLRSSDGSEPVVHFEVNGKASGYELLKTASEVSRLSPDEQIMLAAWGQEMRSSSRGMQSNQVDLIRDVHLESPLMRLLRNTPSGSKEFDAVSTTIQKLLNHEFHSPNAQELPTAYQAGQARMRQSLQSLKTEAIRALTELERTLPNGNTKAMIQELKKDWNNVGVKGEGIAKSIAEKNITLQQAYDRALYRGAELAPTRKGVSTPVQLVKVAREVGTIRETLRNPQERISETTLQRIQAAVSRAIARDPELAQHPLWSAVAGAATPQAIAQVLGGSGAQVTPASILSPISSLGQSISALRENIEQTKELMPKPQSLTGRVERQWNAVTSGLGLTFGPQLTPPQQVGALLDGLPIASAVSDNATVPLQAWVFSNPSAVVSQLTPGKIQDILAQHRAQMNRMGFQASAPETALLEKKLNDIREAATLAPESSVNQDLASRTARVNHNGQPVIVVNVETVTRTDKTQQIPATAAVEVARAIRVSELTGAEVFIQLPKHDLDRQQAIKDMVREANVTSRTNVFIAESGQPALKLGARANENNVIDIGEVRRAIPSISVKQWLVQQAKAMTHKLEAKGPVFNLDQSLKTLRTLQEAESKESLITPLYQQQLKTELSQLAITAQILNRVNQAGLMDLNTSVKEPLTALFSALQTANETADSRKALEAYQQAIGDEHVSKNVPTYLLQQRAAYTTKMELFGVGMQTIPAVFASLAGPWTLGAQAMFSGLAGLFTERNAQQSTFVYLQRVGLKAIAPVVNISNAKAIMQMADFAFGAYQHTRTPSTMVSESVPDNVVEMIPAAEQNKSNRRWRMPAAASLLVGFFASSGFAMGAEGAQPTFVQSAWSTFAPLLHTLVPAAVFGGLIATAQFKPAEEDSSLQKESFRAILAAA